jgi:hypothetical protein
MSGEWDFWIEQLGGGAPETTPGRPHSGFYRDRYYAPTGDGKKREKRSRAVAIWQQDGEFICTVTVGYQPRHLDEIDALFANCCRAPITRDLYMLIADGGAWPDEVPAVDRIVSTSDNEPELSPSQKLEAELNDVKDKARSWFAEIGKKITTQEQSDKAGNFANEFAKLQKKAEDTHKVEKAPHLEAGRAVDAAWKPLVTAAEEAKKWAKKAAEGFLIAEQKRLDDERKKLEQEAEAARKAAGAALMAAEAKAAEAGVPVEVELPVVPHVPAQPERAKAGTSGRSISIRQRTEYQIADLPAAVAYLAALEKPPVDFVEAVQKAVNRIASSGVTVPGVNPHVVEYAA